MNFIPIFKSRFVDKKTNLHIGVEIQYEEQDAEAMMHLLYFLLEEQKRNEGKFFLMPDLLANGSTTTVKAMLKTFNKRPAGERSINGKITFYFLDEMRPLFEAYCTVLERDKKNAEKSFAWNEEHDLYTADNDYRTITKLYFPPKEKMH